MVKLFRLHRRVRYIAPGDYRVIRLFDRERVLVDISEPYSYRSMRNRQITLLPIKKGQLL